MDDGNFKESRYYEFLRVNALSAGIYRLAAGAEDLQKPHTEDEIYYIVQGAGRFCMENEDFDVQEGSVLYVPANAVHKFHSITKDLVIMVIFAPAEQK
jgi:mannose-6-phosphate isomerase-like protein (cupin superfamily)